jgi:hypothetical protein
MSVQEAITWLYQHGYLWKYGVLSLEDALRLSLSSPSVTNALTDAQIFNHARLDFHAEQIYGEPTKVNGVLGDATQAVMVEPRCPIPDAFPPQNATFHYDDPLLQTAVESMQAVGSGSWPQPCQKGGVKFSIDKRNMPSSMQPHIAAIVRDVVEDYAKHGVRLVEVDRNLPDNIHVSWENLDRIGRGVIGLAEFNNQMCSDSVFCKLDPGYYPDNDQIRQLLQHELGHNMNLPHTPQGSGIMSPSITEGWVGFTATDASTPRLARYFGGEPLDPIPGPTPIPPKDGKVTIEGVQTVKRDGVVIGKFIAVPYEEV